MFSTKKFGFGYILLKSNNGKKQIGIATDDINFGIHQNAAVFKTIQMILDKKILVDVGQKKEKIIDNSDFEFYPFQEQYSLVSDKNLFKIPFKRTYELRSIENGIAYYYRKKDDKYIIKDIRKNRFLRIKGNKFFTFSEKKGKERRWYTGESPEYMTI